MHYYLHSDPPSYPGDFSQGLGGMNGAAPAFNLGQLDPRLVGQILQTATSLPDPNIVAKAVSDAASGNTSDLAQLAQQAGSEAIKIQILSNIQDPAQQAKFLQDWEAGKTNVKQRPAASSGGSWIPWIIGAGVIGAGLVFALKSRGGASPELSAEQEEER